jgi:hypothetical protein
LDGRRRAHRARGVRTDIAPACAITLDLATNVATIEHHGRSRRRFIGKGAGT